jgi:hypothetical protein
MKMICVGFAVAVLSGCAAMLDSKIDTSSKQLDQGLSESDVTAKIGQPSSISLATCGSNSANGPWTCKQYIYNGGGAHRLIVYFSKFPDETWHVNNWSVL